MLPISEFTISFLPSFILHFLSDSNTSEALKNKFKVLLDMSNALKIEANDIVLTEFFSWPLSYPSAKPARVNSGVFSVVLKAAPQFSQGDHEGLARPAILTSSLVSLSLLPNDVAPL